MMNWIWFALMAVALVVAAVNGTADDVTKGAIDGASTLGVVYQPVTDKLYAGVVGEGSTLEQHGATRELHVSEVATPSELRRVVSRSHRNRAVAGVVSKLGIREEKQTG